MPVPSITDIITGRNVVVGVDSVGVPAGGKIKVVRTIDSRPFAHSGTSGGMELAEGNVDFTGVYTALGHTPLVFPGETFTLAFTLNGGTTSSGLSAAQTMCTGIDIVVPVMDKTRRNAIYHQVHFGACGYDFSAGGATAGASVAPLSPKSLDFSFAGSDYTQVDEMILSIRMVDSEPQVNSCLAGVYFRPVGNIDWEFRSHIHINSMATLPALNATGALLMEVTNSLKWTINTGRVKSIQTELDRESGELIGAYVSIGMCTLAGVAGSIVTPAGVTKWS